MEMATDTTVSETETCSSDPSDEKKSSALMTLPIDCLKEENNDISESENTVEMPLKKSPHPNDGNADENVPKFVVSDPIHIEVPNDDDISENDVAKNDSKNALLDIHNIQILDDPPLKDGSSKNNLGGAVGINDGCIGEKSVDENDTTNDSVSKDSTIFINDEDVISCNSGYNLKPNNVIVLNPKSNLADKQILNNNLLKGQRVFILNGNVTSKEEVEKTKPDNINIICVSNNLSDIITNIKNDTITSMAPCKSLLTPETADRSVVLKSIEKMINTHQSGVPTINATGPKFIQITQSNYKQISPKINVTTAMTPLITVPKMIAPKPAPVIASVSNEMLRTKLLESEVTSTSPTQTTDSSAAGKKPSSLGVVKKDNEVESPAIARARNEFNKCRKKLIEAAIHPQLPTYKPPVTYEGPIFSCEECDDTFSCTESLKNHKNRRSVLFTYNCPPCNCTLEFYNRCTFLLHVRSHDAAVKACYLTISTIPSDKLNFKLLQQDEVETEIPQHPEKPIPRSKERVPLFKTSDETNDSTPRAEIKENGTDKPKITSISNEKSINVMRNFDFIKSLRKNKFEAYLQNTDRIKKYSNNKPIEKKSDSESSLSEDSSENENATSQETSPNDTTSLNGSTNTSQLKYFLTTNDRNLNSSGKRPIENIQPNVEETASKKPKVNQTPCKEPELPSVSEPPKTKHTPIIIRTKTSSPLKQPDSVAEKFTDEITLTSSSDEEDSETDDNSEENKTVLCRECKTEVTNLNKHIRAENKPLKEFLCEHCKFFSPSQCALQAHIRMHSKTQPYICPDCGFYFNTYETFQTHIKQVCYYDFKAIRFECPECSLLKPSVQAFADHLKRCHTRDVFKCSLCITSSYSTKVVEVHMKRKHVGEEGSVLEGYRCMLCPNILISKKSIDTHINKHVFSLKHLRYVYICKKCKKYASGKRSKFVLHLDDCDDKKKEPVAKPKEKEKITSSKPVTIKTTGKSNRSRSSKSSGGKKDASEVEEKDPLSVEDWEADKLKAQYVPKTKICVMCRSADISSRSNSLFCNTCVCSVNADDTSEGRHESGRPKRKFKCRLCKQLMNKDWATITKHYEQDHSSDLSARSETKSRQPKEAESKKSEKLDKPDVVTPVNIIKKRRHSTKDVTPPAKSPKIEEIIIPSPPKSSGHKCVHCEFATENREEFQTHIVSHKDPNNTQCPECGECFVVDATLAKHLLIKHEVRNLRKYFFENNLFKKEEIVESRKKVKENQCEVCLVKCDSKQSYDKHIRTHGMAFVALQSRVKDDKSPRG